MILHTGRLFSEMVFLLNQDLDCFVQNVRALWILNDVSFLAGILLLYDVYAYSCSKDLSDSAEGCNCLASLATFSCF